MESRQTTPKLSFWTPACFGGAGGAGIFNSRTQLWSSAALWGMEAFSLHCSPLGGPRLSPGSRSGASSVGDC